MWITRMGLTCLCFLAQHAFDLLDGLGLHAELVFVTDTAVRGDVTHDCFSHVMHQGHLHAARGIHTTVTGQQRHHAHPVHVVCVATTCLAQVSTTDCSIAKQHVAATAACDKRLCVAQVKTGLDG
jgi:uncharacterized iron-regulated protein